MNSASISGRRRSLLALMSACAALASCGGGGGDAGSPAPAPQPGLNDAVRTQAATATAQSTTNACAGVQPFYWEIGDRAAKIASASVNVAGNATTYDANSLMGIASASKWLYGGYVVERRGAGGLTAQDIKFLNFRSGYTSFSICSAGQTVGSCLAAGSNGDYTAANDGKFFYGGGHMQKHASLIGLDAMDSAALATEIRSQIGTDIVMSFSQPQPAGGVRTTPAEYAKYLRKLLNGDLRMGAALGTQAVCTNPATCTSAVSTPVPLTESWHYSLGHWVEDDPVAGDGAFSSPGAFGFYPWIDAGKTYYGVLARQVIQSGEGIDSALCGRLIRKAWQTGVAQ